MGVLDFVKSGVQEMMIARPDQLKGLIVYKHPDQNIPMYSQLTVDSDECAVFFKDGRVVGVLGPGRHTLQSQNIPFLNGIVTSFTGGQVFIAEVFFVKTSPLFGVPFGGPVGDMLDPLTGEQVCPRIFGEMAVQITDPVRFIVNYSGQAAGGNNYQILNWVKGLFLNAVRTTLGELCEVEGRSVLQAMSLRQKLAQTFVQKCPDLNEIGIRVVQMGDYQINFSDEDRDRLKEANAEIAKAQRAVRVKQIGVAGAAADAQAQQFALDQKFQQDARYVQQLAGSYQGYAAGQAMMGAGQGMATHGVGEGGVAGMGAQMAIGMGIGGAMAAPYAQPQFPVAGAPQPGQPQMGAVPPGAGAGPVSGKKRFCTACGGEVFPAAKFCANCGTPQAAPGG